MSDWFGHKWKAHVGPEPLDSWAYGLAGLSRLQIKTGIDSLTDCKKEWPPSLPEFREMCLQKIDRTDGASIAAQMPTHRALPIPPEVAEKRKALAKKYIAKCREILAA